jgi:hypothetical protein
MHMWHHVTNHLIISNDKDSNSENRIKLRVRDNVETSHAPTTQDNSGAFYSRYTFIQGKKRGVTLGSCG